MWYCYGTWAQVSCCEWMISMRVHLLNYLYTQNVLFGQSKSNDTSAKHNILRPQICAPFPYQMRHQLVQYNAKWPLRFCERNRICLGMKALWHQWYQAVKFLILNRHHCQKKWDQLKRIMDVIWNLSDGIDCGGVMHL